MTPKEKAVYLYIMFKQRTHYVEVMYTPELLDKFHNNAISCALIAVNEILKENLELPDEPETVVRYIYWQEVKQEIENL